MTSSVLALGRLAIIAGLVLLAIFLGLWLSARPAAAGSQLSGEVRGWEFCTQSICGSAHFLGLFDGLVTQTDGTEGAWQLSVRHEDLPDPQGTAAITGGDWRLRVGWRTHFQGDMAEGIIYNNGDESFAVKAKLTETGEEARWFYGLLDHSSLPPSVKGCIVQSEPLDPPNIDPCG